MAVIGYCLVRQSERLSLHGAVGGDVESATSGAADMGTAGNEAHRRCRDHTDCLCAFLRAVSDHDDLSNHDQKHQDSPYRLTLML